MPWAVVAALVVAGLWWYFGRPEGGGLAAQTAASAEPESSSTPTPTPGSTPGRQEGTDGGQGGEPRPLITKGVSIQVLDSVGSKKALDRMVERLTALGFSVPFEAEASTTYGATTVFWSYSEAKGAARRLAERFGWDAGPKPGNLSTDVALHVVVGRDEA